MDRACQGIVDVEGADRQQPRAYDPRDAPDVARFFADLAAGDPTIVPITESGWRSFAARSFNREARDFAVVEEAGRVIGLLTSTLLVDHDPPLRHFRIFIHPSRRRRGIGTDLLALVESQDPNREVILQCNNLGSWVAGRAFLERHEFGHVRSHLEMERAGAGPPPTAPPRDVTIRPYRANVRDDAAWRQLNDTGYRGDPDFQDLTADDLALFRETEGFELWFAELHGNPVGLCHVALDDEEKGRVESVVVEPRARGRGIGRALLVTGLRGLDERGIDRITLGVVADNVAAVSLYRSLDFEVSEELETWWRGPDLASAR